MARISAGDIKDIILSDLYASAYVPTIKRLCERRESNNLTDGQAFNAFMKLTVKGAREMRKQIGGRLDTKVVLMQCARNMLQDFESQYRATRFNSLRRE